MLVIWASQQQRNSEWVPTDLGAKLLAWWDAEDAATLTLSGSQIAGWEDKVTGVDLTQGVGGSRPVYQATGFNGRPAAYFDGIDDYLELAAGGSFLPTAANACEIYSAVDSPSGATDSTSGRTFFTYGGPTSSTFRRVRRLVSGVSSIFSIQTGTNTASATGVEFQGRQVAVGRITGTTTTARLLPGGTDGTTPAVPATTTGTTRIGCNNFASPGAFWLNKINTIIVTDALTTDERTLLETYLQGRL